jgi:hypothetical protein
MARAAVPSLLRAQCLHDEWAGETIQCRRPGQKSVQGVQSGRRFYFVRFRKVASSLASAGKDMPAKPWYVGMEPGRIYVEADLEKVDDRQTSGLW